MLFPIAVTTQTRTQELCPPLPSRASFLSGIIDPSLGSFSWMTTCSDEERPGDEFSCCNFLNYLLPLHEITAT